MSSSTSMPPKPNIIWVVADQLRAQALSCNGEVNIATPNIDQLAERGVNFSNALSGYPLCCPFRGSMLTGLYPHKCTPGHEAGLPQQQETIADVFNSQGYHTSYFGKWHLDPMGAPQHVFPEREALYVVPPASRGGFQRWLGYQNNNDPWDCYVHGGEGDARDTIKLEGYETDALTDLMIDYLKEKHDKPFFSVLSVFPPHNPYVAPAEYCSPNIPANITLRKNVPDVDWVTQQAKKELSGYYAMVRNLDYNVGRLVEAIQKSGLSESTYIVFFSDHGDTHGSHGMFRKTNPYEESIRIPFIVSTCPGNMYRAKPSILYGFNGANKTDAVLNHVDIAPTTLGLCNIATPQWMQGTDYSDCYKVKGNSQQALVEWDLLEKPYPKEALLQSINPTMHINSPSVCWRGIVTRDGWKYICTENQPWLLFNLKDDPYEQMNMIHIVEYLEIARDLNQRLKKLLEKTGDVFPLPEFPNGITFPYQNGIYKGEDKTIHY